MATDLPPQPPPTGNDQALAGCNPECLPGHLACILQFVPGDSYLIGESRPPTRWGPVGAGLAARELAGLALSAPKGEEQLYATWRQSSLHHGGRLRNR